MLLHSRHRRPMRPAPRRRGTRAQTACISCKERKLKCDDQVPACANCHRLDLACLVEDPTTKRQLPRNYLETLEERVELLERLLQQQNQPQVSAGSAMPGFRDFNYLNVATTSSGVRDRDRDENDATTDLISRAGVLSLHASGAEPHYFGPSSIFSFSRVIHACVRQAVQEKPRSEFDPNSDEMDASSLVPCRLPSYEIGVALSNAYFENVHLQYPFLHEPTFRKWERNAVGLDSVVASPTELFFVNIVYSIGALLKSNTRCLPQQLYVSALLYIDHVLSKKNVEAIQALLCCALFSIRSSMGPSVWNLSGLALRQCIELGYHRNVKKINLRTNILRLELRKRVFWCAYQMDCASSVNLGLPLSLPIQEVDTEFPLDINDSSITEDGMNGLPRQSSSDPITTTSHALHQFRVRCIWARIYESLYSNTASERHDRQSYLAQVQKLRKELDDWLAETPPEPRRPSIPITVFARLEDYKATYNESLLFLYRGQLTDKEKVQDDVFLECMQAASDICQSCKRLYIGKPINYTWSTLHVIFLAGLTNLHCLWTSTAVRQAVRIDSVSNTFTTCTMLLAIMAERWEGAAPYRDLFEALASRAMAMMVERKQHETAPALPAPSAESDNPNIEDLTLWASQIADVGMPDAFGSLLSGLIGDYSLEGQEFGDGLWEF
ncbi:fungal-specific transcription factor domain-containing protein [Dactylonectria estremocensis]|uniref:Fungal-specific transcription factor domain-containing protein n=1 Tax=Dactylonectria estremocensis TaxID=1079267 RepID=A0A9P9IPG5_9HYPO|nr:fungal-specific transcription factor domain-containing protein [Dactylonectria estremocensis]